MDKIELYYKGKKANWYENALTLNPRPWSNRDVVNKVVARIFEEVEPIVKPGRAINRTREAIKVILLNLFIAYKLGMPVRYSRNPNRYSKSKRYGKLFFKYGRTVPVIDALRNLGYVGNKNGFNDEERCGSKESRMWATPKLIKLFQEFELNLPGLIEKTQHEELIHLKNLTVVKRGKREIKIKKQVDYEDTEETIHMRNNLTVYNNFIKEQDITLTLNQETIVNQWFMRDLMYNLLKGVISLNLIQLKHKTNIQYSSSIATYSNIYQYDRYDKATTILNYPTITHKIRDLKYPYILQYTDDEAYYRFIDYITTLISDTLKIENNTARNKVLKNECNLSEFGIIKIQFTINYNFLHRVFSRSSFDFNGRFFDAFHIGMPRHIRKTCLSINGNPTVEPDYSSLHIRMLYHLEGIQYTDDPYIALCSNEDDRGFYKTLQLVAINADTEAKAIKAVRKEIRERQYSDYFTATDFGSKWDLSDKHIASQLRRFEEIHKPIAKYLNKDIGLTLQNYDSRITEAILVRLMMGNIPCLPVHDSYIVQVIHTDALVNAMIEEYEKVMGFPPIVKID